jgi:[protein-PII] uridylyltransferase
LQHSEFSAQYAELPFAERCSQVDALVLRAFEAAQLAATVCAVGGYGRCELFPYSDVDLLVLVDSAASADAAKDSLSRFQRQLWDAGLRIAQSVRTVEECCEIHEGNLELTISLLDRRYLCGDSARYQALEPRFARFLVRERSDIVRHLCRMTESRHAHYGGTIYHLEPNVKEHPGGLRDLHVLHWLGLLGVRNGGAPDDRNLRDAREFLLTVRTALHRNSGRDNNLLSFEAQETLSADPAAWMREYFRHAREVFRALGHALHKAEISGSGLLSQFRERRARLSNHEFTISHERLLLREPGLFETDAGAPMRLLQFAARHNVRLAEDTEKKLQKALALFQRQAEPWRAWKELLSLRGCASAFRALHEAGLMAALIPEWERIDALVTRDFYHRYTVDEHTIVALENLDALAEAGGDPVKHRFSALLWEAQDAALLRLALLLHDIGKGGGSGEHAQESVAIAAKVLDRLNAPAADRETVTFLIEHHLDLSSVINSRDLEDPATAHSIAGQTGTLERLSLLTLMTYADVSAVNPQAMTPWRLDRLWRLFSVGRYEFTRELESERIHASAGDSETAQFLEGLPVRYARTHASGEIRAHLKLAREAAASGAAVRIVKEDGFFRAEIVSRDRPFLLASLSGTLAGFGMNISRAEAFANDRGICLDTFVFSDPHRSLELNPSEIDRLADMLRHAASGTLNVERLLRLRPKPARNRRDEVEHLVHFNNEASENATLIEITARDRPGLLYDLAQAISSQGLNIEVILINTEGHKAFDVFYVTKGRHKLDEEGRASLEERLRVASR